MFPMKTSSGLARFGGALRKTLLTATAGALLAASVPATAASTYFGYTRITNNGPDDVASQFFTEVAEHNQGVLFSFYNTVSSYAASITQIYFEENPLGGLFSSLTIHNQSAGVDYSTPASPDNLPSGNNWNFTANHSFGPNSPTAPNGINASNEWLSLLGVLNVGQAYTDVIDALVNGALRIGMHAQAISATGNSDSFINSLTPLAAGVTPPGVTPGGGGAGGGAGGGEVSPVPLPAAGWLFVSAVLGFGAMARRRRG